MTKTEPDSQVIKKGAFFKSLWCPNTLIPNTAQQYLEGKFNNVVNNLLKFSLAPGHLCAGSKAQPTH